MRTTRTTLAMFMAGFALAAAPLVASAQAAAPAQVTCTDGAMSAGGKGACRGHGGIKKGEAKAAHAAKVSKVAKSKGATAAVATPAVAMSKPAVAVAAPKAATTKHAAMAASTPKAATTKPMAMAAPAPKTAVAPSMVAATASGTAIAKCKDNSLSYNKVHKGSCSTHGGVAQWLDGTVKKP